MLAAAFVLFALAGYFMYQLISRQYQIRKAESDNSQLREDVMSVNDGFSDLRPAPDGDDEETAVSGEITYRYSVDFDKLQERNPDACAWLDIPNTDMSFLLPIIRLEISRIKTEMYWTRTASVWNPE